MLDLDDPNVWVSLTLARYVRIRMGLGDPGRTRCPHPQKLSALTTSLC